MVENERTSKYRPHYTCVVRPGAGLENYERLPTSFGEVFHASFKSSIGLRPQIEMGHNNPKDLPVFGRNVV